MIPAHKQTDPNKAPGQIKTIGDYVISVQQEEALAELAATNQRLYPEHYAARVKKLSFEDWWNLNMTARGCYYGMTKTQCSNLWAEAQKNV